MLYKESLTKNPSVAEKKTQFSDPTDAKATAWAELND